MRLEKADLINKFLQIESWSYRGRHLSEVAQPDDDKLKKCLKHIRVDLEELEIMLGVED